METMARWVHRTKKTCWFSITNGFPWPHGIHLSCIWWCRRASVYCAISLGVQSENLGDWDRWQFRSEPIWTNHWLVTFLRCLQFFFFTTTIFQWTPIDGRAKKGLHLSNRWGRWMAWYHDRKTCSPKRKLQEVKCASTLLSASYTSAIFISYKSHVFFSCFVG